MSGVAPGGAVLPVDKPEGPTSHDVVGLARRALGERRIGHTGTLDPFASGLLLLCVGRATRLSEYLSALDKTYEATARLGVSTDTEDREGRVTSERDGWQSLARGDVEAALASFRGPIEQVPPQFSAKKVDGEAMHRRARRGEAVRLEARPVTVHELELLGFQPPQLSFRVRCSSGTYVRSLARDIGERLGCGAHLTRLRRTRIGSHDVDGALDPARLGDPAAVAALALDPLRALAHLPSLEVDGESAARLRRGQAIPSTGEGDDVGPIVLSCAGTLVAVAAVAGGRLHPRKVFES